MSFLSWQYALFLAVVFLTYWQLPLRGRLALLLAGSYFFYGAWDVRFLALLLTSTAIDFYCGLAIDRQRRPGVKVFAVACLPAIWLLACDLIFHDQVRFGIGSLLPPLLFQFCSRRSMNFFGG